MLPGVPGWNLPVWKVEDDHKNIKLGRIMVLEEGKLFGRWEST